MHSGNISIISYLQSANIIQHASRVPRMPEFLIHPLIWYVTARQLQPQNQKWTQVWASNSNFPTFSVILDRKPHADWQNLILCEKQWLMCSYAFSYHTLLLPEELSGLALINISNGPSCNRLETNFHCSAFSLYIVRIKLSILSQNKSYAFECSSVRFSFPLTSEGYQTMKRLALFCIIPRNRQLSVWPRTIPTSSMFHHKLSSLCFWSSNLMFFNVIQNKK